MVEQDKTSPATDKKWRAVCERDQRFDKDFVFAVATTGIYCRPSCPARRPRRENAVFFDDAEEAEQHGFRPCKRCLPDAGGIAERHLKAIKKACMLIETAEELPSSSELAQALGMSVSHFHRQFKQLVGVTPKEYAAGKRVQRLQEKLQTGARVTDAIFDAGFNSSSRSYATAKSTLGMTHSSYRAGGRDAQVRYVSTKTPLGWLLVATTDHGICSIELGDTRKSLHDSISQRFPQAKLVHGDENLVEAVNVIVDYIETPDPGLELPLHIQGTAFQRRVWRALQQIPAGKTASYKEIAESIGQPKASRAVAQACGANTLAIVIPCHRVVRADGTAGGYRWGRQRKKALLKRESTTGN